MFSLHPSIARDDRSRAPIASKVCWAGSISSALTLRGRIRFLQGRSDLRVPRYDSRREKIGRETIWRVAWAKSPHFSCLWPRQRLVWIYHRCWWLTPRALQPSGGRRHSTVSLFFTSTRRVVVNQSTMLIS